MQSIQISLPDDIFFEVQSQPKRGSSFDEKLKQHLAIGMFVSQEISLAKAAELAEKNLPQFMAILKELDIPCLTYTEEMLEDDLNFSNK